MFLITPYWKYQVHLNGFTWMQIHGLPQVAIMSEQTEPRRLLVVDDDALMARLMTRAVGDRLRERVQVLTTTDAGKALRMAQAGDIDICLTDMDMPTVNGFKLLKEIKRHNPLSQVILITAYPTTNAARSAFQMGADDFFPKPIDVDAVFRSVEFAIDRIERLQRELIE